MCLSCKFQFIYRVTHETWQLVKNFGTTFSYIVFKIWRTFCVIFFIILFGIKELNKICKKTFNTIHQLSCFVGHLYIVQWTFSLFVDVCLLFCANNETAKPILIGPTFCGRSHKPRKGLRMVKFSRIVTVKNCL